MAERAINQKNKSSFFISIASSSTTLDDRAREQLQCGKFPLTKTAWIKNVATLVCLASLALFLAQDWEPCISKPSWFITVFLSCIGSSIGVQLLFYLIFSCGGAVGCPGKWVAADIIFNLIFSIVGIIGSVIVTATKINCRENVSMHNIPGPLGIAGGVISIIGCAAIFLKYRYVEEEEEAPPPTPLDRNVDFRKSMHA